MSHLQKNTDMAPVLFRGGVNFYAYDYLGAHLTGSEGDYTYTFRLWAPNAKSVSLVGDFNSWNQAENPMEKDSESGIWHCEITRPYRLDKNKYKFAVTGADGRLRMKADPYCFFSETLSKSASIIYDIDGYEWGDAAYTEKRCDILKKGAEKGHFYPAPMNIYELHAGSWKTRDGKTNTEGDAYLNYREIADALAPYLIDMGYTHVELMPIAEHPYDGSWGYQICEYFAPTSRFGEPKDFMYFVDKMHKNGIGVIMDWVPAHFPKDEHGLSDFDGTRLYEYQGNDRFEQKTWGTRCFDVGRPEVESFLVSNALFWMRKYHIDGLRIDAVASMLYLDYDRRPGEWCPNTYGGNECLEAIAFFRKLNTAVFAEFPAALMIAEESTAWPLITKPADVGGLGFNFKWNMGWANDMFEYMQTDPFFRSGIHNKLTFPMMYAFSENFILPVSHDEVVHGKRSLLDKMFGEYEDKFRSMRAFMAYMMTLPGKKMLFMGTEYGPFREWDYENELEWFMLKYPAHHAMHEYVRALNQFYLATPALYEIDDSWDGFEWIDADLASMNLISYRRIDTRGRSIYVVLNFAPVEWDYEMRVKRRGEYEAVFSSDDKKYGGSGTAGEGTVYRSQGRKTDGKTEQYIKMKIPGYGALILKSKSPKKKK